MALEEIRNERVKKLKNMEEAGVDVFPAEVKPSEDTAAVLKNFAKYAKTKKAVTVCGRIFAKREHGRACFVDLKDASGKIQLLFKSDILGEKSYGFFIENIDIGDFLEASGRPFLTKRGEKTLEISSWGILAKSLRPLPEKWHGLQDVEERFRKRYLDLLMNEEAREKFLFRSRVIKALRDFLFESGFEEVETPMLQPLAGGALARPFKTHHNALNSDLYLRIAPELYLKRLLIGGWKKIFEIGRNFRNEGIDQSHNPEFTMLELYAAYWDENQMMKFVEDICFNLLQKTLKKKNSEYDGFKIAWKKPFLRLPFTEALKRYALTADYQNETKESLILKAKQLGLEIEKYASKGKIADEIFKKICRPHLKNPTFVIGHPLEISPLAKAQGPTLTEKSRTLTARRFQLIAGGLEIANGFSELNNPLEQRTRFEEQEKERGGGEEEAHRLDEDFLEAMEYGMPPAAGLGIGIDRLVMLLTNTRNVKEVILFPAMKSKS